MGGVQYKEDRRREVHAQAGSQAAGGLHSAGRGTDGHQITFAVCQNVTSGGLFAQRTTDLRAPATDLRKALAAVRRQWRPC